MACVARNFTPPFFEEFQGFSILGGRKTIVQFTTTTIRIRGSGGDVRMRLEQKLKFPI